MRKQMKDSGISWIGQIPQEWKTKRIKYACEKITDGSHFSPEIMDDGKTYITVSDVKDNFVDIENAKKISFHEYQELVKNGCQPHKGDVLLSKDGTVGKSVVMEFDPDYVVLSSLGILTPLKELDSKFLKYSLDSNYLQEQMARAMDGSALKRITISKIREFNLTFPSLTEQNAIADFLDRECAKIDSIAADLEKQIELLQQYKKSLITEAVTKGLDKSTPLKDSGNRTIGKINQNYFIKKLKYIVSTPITDGPHETPVLVDEGIPFLSAESVKNGILDFNYKRGYITEADHKYFCQKIKPQKNDVFIVKSGATTGKSGIVTTDEEFSIWSPLALIRCDNKTVLQKFIYYSTQSIYFMQEIEQSWSYGTQQNIGMGILGNLPVVIPPIMQQKSIVTYLDKSTNFINKLIADKEYLLDTIQMHKKSLIYEYVTGKKRLKEVK